MIRDGGILLDKYCNNSWSQIVELLNSNAQNGLSEKDCEAIKERFGSNKLDLPNGNRLIKHIFNGIKDKCTIIYILIVIFLFALKYYMFAGIILGLLLLNLILTIVHNFKRDEEIGALQNINSENATVIRDGIEKVIRSEELVIGDIVKFSRDSLVPADIRIITAKDLKVDEKNITGENFYKEKFESKIDGNIYSLTDMKNILFKGSIIKAGEGTGIVVSVGNSTQLGRLLTMLTYASSRKHNFGEGISGKFLKRIGPYFVVLALSGILLFYSGQDMNNLATAMFALGCFPISIISIISFKGIIKKFSDENIDIINFSVFNLIKNVNILFLDKVGAITKKEMFVKKIFINNNVISVESPYVRDITYDRIMEISLICNNSTYNIAEDNGKGELSEIAFLRYAAKKKIYKSEIDVKNERIFDIPIDSDKRFLTVVSKMKNRYRANTKGNLDGVLEKCTHIMVDGVEKELTDEYRASIKEVDMNLSLEGLITQGFAYRNFTYEPSKSENIESNMVFVGIIGLENPLEDDIEYSINLIKDKAIVPILFTEENKLSAITNAKKAKIIRNDNQVVAGIEMDSLNHKELIDLLSRVRVFCRVTPEIKSKIVAMFVKDGHNVATTGETLGDLPALNLSNVGIGKGNASGIVKKVSDVYIKKNYLDGFFKIRDFAKVLDRNIDRGFNIFYTTVLSEILILILSMVLSANEILDVWNVLFINGILFLILSPIILINQGRDISKNELIIRSIITTSIIMWLTYQVNGSSCKLIGLTILSISMLFFVLFNSNVSIRKYSKELIIGIVSLLLIITAIVLMTLLLKIEMSNLVLIEFIGTIIFLLIFEILFRKWQNSLMR